VKAREQLQSEPVREACAPRLGDVLYAGTSHALVTEKEWVDLVRSVAAGEQAALHALFDRAHRIVFTLAVRITGNGESAEEVTLDVFHDVWRRAGAYDPANGTVLGWIMNQARSRAIDRVRFEQRKKRREPASNDEMDAGHAADPRGILERHQVARLLGGAVAVLTPDERQAIECAYFRDLTHAEVAAHLAVPLGTVKTRIRSALCKLRRAMQET